MPKSVEEGRERVGDTERELLSCADRGRLRDRVVFVREPMAKIEAAKHANQCERAQLPPECRSEA